MSTSRFILLSFDVEEFDMPLEYGHAIAETEQFSIGKQGLDAINSILSDRSITTTLFTTANFASVYPEAIKLLAEQHEIASHTYYHSSFAEPDLLKSKQTLESITGKLVTGLRMPRMRKVEMDAVRAAGYTYDSSINPTWLPGRYNNLHLPRTTYTEAGITRVPASVSPNLHIPLFWLMFKNMPLTLFKSLAIQTLKKDGYLCLYFHPWEFVPIQQYGLPRFTRRWCEGVLLERLNKLIETLKKEGEFITMESFVNKRPR